MTSTMMRISAVLITFLIHWSLVICEYPKFPNDFIFGVATAAHQIEGAWNVSGKSENVWDRLSHTRNELIADGSNGDVAVDSYHRFEEDVEELKYLGVDFYRLSFSWARILPTGRNDIINPDGIRYYKDLLNLLKQNNIKALVTLFHWDLPQTLQDLGGWANPILINYFEDYALICFEQFGDLVDSWITFNEPYEICEDAYGDILKAPAIDSHGVGNYLCSENLLKAHAKAYHLYDDEFRSKHNGEIMISINSIWYEPEDVNNKELVELANTANQFKFGWFAHPIFTTKGGWPQAMIDNIAEQSKAEGLSRSRLPEFSEEWIEYIKGTSDQLGINHYTTHLITAKGVDPGAKSPSWLKDIGGVTSTNIGTDSASAWLRVVPYGFRNLLNWCKDEYNNPRILITENGFSDRGDILDYGRIKYFNDYLTQILYAIYEDNIKVTGYTAWTLMDNFEWRAGFSERFGFYRVDITDPQLPRIKKLSADYYRIIMEQRELVEDVRFKEPQVGNKSHSTGERVHREDL